MATRKPTSGRSTRSTQTMRDELQELRIGSQVHKALEGVLEGLSEVQSDLRNVNTKLTLIAPQLANIEAQTTKTNGRVTVLEMWKAKSTGVMAAIAAMASLIGWLVAQVFSFVK